MAIVSRAGISSQRNREGLAFMVAARTTLRNT